MGLWCFMKKALILHGAGNNSSGNWFPWLKQELEKRGYRAWSPDLPDSDQPNLNNWLATVLGNKDWSFGEESVIIGHSAGATLILRILEQLPAGIKINRAVLVAGTVELGTKPEYFQYKEDLTKLPFNWTKIKNSCRHFYFIHSDNDKYECGTEQGRIMQQNLGGELIVKPGEGHFNLEQGLEYRQFPLIPELL